jgi:hypothetical protein
MASAPEGEPQPSRPNWKWAVAAAAFIVVAEAASHWSEVSAYAHIPEIMHTLGFS